MKCVKQDVNLSSELSTSQRKKRNMSITLLSLLGAMTLKLVLPKGC